MDSKRAAVVLSFLLCVGAPLAGCGDDEGKTSGGPGAFTAEGLRSVWLVSYDAARKVSVVKVVREVTGLGLAEAKALVEGAPRLLKGDVSASEAERILRLLDEAGAKGEIR